MIAAHDRRPRRRPPPPTLLPSAGWAERYQEVSFPSFDFLTSLRYGSVAFRPHRRRHSCSGKDSARPADNLTVIIEFRVDDVDSEYERLKPLVGDWVQEPTTMPWGNRSILFSDPDGNLVNFFTPVTEDAIKKFNGRLGNATQLLSSRTSRRCTSRSRSTAGGPSSA